MRWYSLDGKCHPSTYACSLIRARVRMHALEGLACRSRVTLASSHALPCSGDASTSPACHGQSFLRTLLVHAICRKHAVLVEHIIGSYVCLYSPLYACVCLHELCVCVCVCVCLHELCACACLHELCACVFVCMSFVRVYVCLHELCACGLFGRFGTVRDSMDDLLGDSSGSSGSAEAEAA